MRGHCVTSTRKLPPWSSLHSLQALQRVNKSLTRNAGSLPVSFLSLHNPGEASWGILAVSAFTLSQRVKYGYFLCLRGLSLLHKENISFHWKGSANQPLPSAQITFLLPTSLALQNILKPQNTFLGKPGCRALTFKKLLPLAS